MPPQADPNRGRLRVGLAGFGMAGEQLHAPLLTRAGLDLVAIATANPGRVAQAQDRHPAARIVPDLAALLTLDLDLVVLATPTGLHEQQALLCCEAAVATVIDKPLATSADGARRVVAAFAAAGVPVSVFQNRRYDVEHTTFLALLATGRLGRIVRMEQRWERWRPIAKDRWRERAEPAQGGGLLLDLHAHLIDNAVCALGPVESVYAELSALTTVAEDVAFLACRHAGGARAHLGATSLAAAPGPWLRALGTGGAYVIGALAGEETVFTGWDDQPGCTGMVVRGDHREGVATSPADPADYYRAVAQAIEGGGPMPVDAHDAIHVLDVIDAARISAATDQVVPVRST